MGASGLEHSHHTENRELSCRTWRRKIQLVDSELRKFVKEACYGRKELFFKNLVLKFTYGQPWFDTTLSG
jgi:hypothetical protein